MCTESDSKDQFERKYNRKSHKLVSKLNMSIYKTALELCESFFFLRAPLD